MEASRFISRKLAPAELKYAAFDRELLVADANFRLVVVWSFFHNTLLLVEERKLSIPSEMTTNSE